MLSVATGCYIIDNKIKCDAFFNGGEPWTSPPLVWLFIYFLKYRIDIATSREELGFKFKHLGRLYDVFQWPDTITVISFYEDPSKDCDINGDEPLLFFCLECHVLTSTEQFWGWSYEKWRLFLASEWWMVNHHRLTNLFFFLPQLKMYNDAIRLRIVTFHGDGFPTEGELANSVSHFSTVCRVDQLSIWSLFLAASVVKFQIKIPLFGFPSNDVPGWSCKVFVRTSQWSDATTTITFSMGPNKMKLWVKFQSENIYNLRHVLFEATLRRNVRAAHHGVYVTTLQTQWILPWALAGLKLNCFSSSGKSQSEVMTERSQ